MTRRRILIDGYNLSLPAGTGIATYARGLAATVQALGHEVGILYGPPSLPEDPLLREMLFFEPPRRPRHPGNLGAAWRQMRQVFTGRRSVAARPVLLQGLVRPRAGPDRLPAHDRLWAVQGLFELADIRYVTSGRFLEISLPEPPDLVHWTYTLPIRVLGARNVYTIHDMVPFLLPEATQVDKRRFLALTRAVAAQADHILTVSEHSREDIVRLLGVPHQRVSNTYQSIELPPEAAQRPPADLREEVEQAYRLPFGEYLLYFGAIEPKKNLIRLIEAYLRSGVRVPLVILGKLAWDAGGEAKLLADPALRYEPPLDRAPAPARGLRHIDYAPRAALAALVRGAKAVVFPSLYEGFGLPALEAMQLGTPVLASTEGALPEVCGDAALLVDPYDAGSIADSLRRLDGDADLRRSLAGRGSRRALDFSRERYAARLAEVYQRLLPDS